jgi:DNA polymerase III subunit chi
LAKETLKEALSMNSGLSSPALQFYHLLTTPFEHAFCSLAEKMYATGKKAVIQVENTARLEYLNNLLWTYADHSFLPHGSAADGNAAEQPLYLTAQDDNPNQSVLRLLLEGVDSSHIPTQERVLILFDGHDQRAVARAREQWTFYKEAAYPMAYYKQNEQGRWEGK